MKERFIRMLKSYINKYDELKNIDKALNKYLFSIAGNTDRVAIWGTGGHTDNLLGLLDLHNLNIVCFIDKAEDKQGKLKNNIRIINPHEIKDFQPDIIIISSYAFRKEIREDLDKLSDCYIVIDFYDRFNFGFSFFGDQFGAELNNYAKRSMFIYNDLKSLNCELCIEMKKKVLEIVNENNLDINNSDLMEIVLDKNSIEKVVNKKRIDGKIIVDFFIQYPQGWTSIESVWQAFNNDERVISRLVQIPFTHSFKDNSNDEIRKFFIEHKFPFIPWYVYDIDNEKPDIVIYQSPYDSTRPKEFSVDRVSEKTRIVYIPYGLEIGGGQTNIERQFNLSIHNKSWIVFSRSKRHRNMYKKYCDSGAGHVIVTGHPKFDSIYNLKKNEIRKDILRLTDGKKVILWNPHFSVGVIENWSTFNIWKDIILDIFEERREEAFLIIRPHPLLLDRIDKNCENEIIGISSFKSRVKNMSNVYIDRDFDYSHSFIVSDALISDASSFLLEYLPTNKPIMYLPNIDGPGLNDDGDIVQYYYNGFTSKQIEDFIDMVINEIDFKKEIRLSKITEYLGTIDGMIGQRIKENVIQKYYLTEQPQNDK